jgi:hypothetical protein
MMFIILSRHVHASTVRVCCHHCDHRTCFVIYRYTTQALNFSFLASATYCSPTSPSILVRLRAVHTRSHLSFIMAENPIGTLEAIALAVCLLLACHLCFQAFRSMLRILNELSPLEASVLVVLIAVFFGRWLSLLVEPYLVRGDHGAGINTTVHTNTDDILKWAN